jgi:hypothetical protein
MQDERPHDFEGRKPVSHTDYLVGRCLMEENGQGIPDINVVLDQEHRFDRCRIFSRHLVRGVLHVFLLHLSVIC